VDKTYLASWTLSTLAVVPLLASGSLNLLHHPVVVKNMTGLGWSEGSLRPLGFAKIVIAILTLIPATSFIGVILATGWMGGAIASHLRAGDRNIALQTALPILIWIGWGLRHQAAIAASF
jgi:hypothetical protein